MLYILLCTRTCHIHRRNRPEAHVQIRSILIKVVNDAFISKEMLCLGRLNEETSVANRETKLKLDVTE